MRYSTVLLDADMTLMDFDTDEKTALLSVLKEHGIESEGVYELYHEINISFWKRYELGEIEKSEIGKGRFTKLLEYLGIDGDGVQWNREFCQRLCLGGRLLEGAEELCKSLKSLGCSAHIITNGTEYIQLSRLGRSGLTKYVDRLFISERVGYQKPKKEFFDYVLRELNITDKSDVIIVGDSLSSDIKGGLNSGIDTCHFNPNHIEYGSDIIPTYSIGRLSELLDIIK